MARYRERSQDGLGGRREPRRALRAGRHRRGLPRSPRPRAPSSDARALLGALQAGRARRDRPLLLARLRDGQDGRQDRERSPQARRHRGRRRRAARPRSSRRCRCARCPASGRAASSGCCAAGLVTIGDLARQDDAALAALGMGKVGRDLRERARGVDPRPGRRRGLGSGHDRRGDDVRPRSARPARDGAPSSRRSPRTCSRASSATASRRAP